MLRYMRCTVLVLGMLLAVDHAMSQVPVSDQSGGASTEWRTYAGDLRSHRYSPLDQIKASDFSELEIAWRFTTQNLGPRPEYRFQSTPLVANGVLYSTAGARRAVVALDSATGEMLWMYSLHEGERGEASPRRLSGRGLAYWTDGEDKRIISVTRGYQLIALNASTGHPISGFGRNGIVDLKDDNDQQIDPITGEVGLHAAPVVAGNTIIVGAAHRPGGVPKSMFNVKGYVRGYDVRTGKRLWIFHTIPLPGEYGNETWENDSWSYTGNTGVWGQVSVDEEFGLVYLPVETPTGDYYGGHRPGDNLYGESLVAVDLRTGERKWHFQLVHHPIWDMDVPPAPILADITVGGRTIKAVAQLSKQCFVYVFDRLTGEPVWLIEERPVPKGDVPGEWYSPTQPFPTKPPALCRNGVSKEDLIDFTPRLRDAALELAAKYKLGPIFTPPVLANPEGPIATLYASAGGGVNWAGGSFDPETNILYASSQSMISSLSVVPPPPGVSDMAYIAGANQGLRGGGGRLTVEGLPLGKPPYGQISALDLNSGEILWQTPHGDTPDYIRNHSALEGLRIPRTGQPGSVGTLVTKTLVIAGDSGVSERSSGQRGAMLRAYDKATGEEVGAVEMPAPQTGSPMTYMVNGVQYIVVAISGNGLPGELIAFRRPE